MTWSTAPPTEPGFYWYVPPAISKAIWHNSPQPEVAELVETAVCDHWFEGCGEPRPEGMVMFRTGRDDCDEDLPEKNPGGLWWATPIQPPNSLETPDPNITPPPNAYITEGFKDDEDAP